MTAAGWPAALSRVLVVVGACGAVAAVASRSDHTVTIGATSAPAAAVRVAVDGNSLACPGPEFTGVAGVEDVDTRPLVVAGSAPEPVSRAARVQPAGAPRLDIAPLSPGEDADPRDGARSDAVTGDIAWRARGDRALTITAGGVRAPGLAAAQEDLIDDPAAARAGIRGLIGVACGDPVADAWLLGGGGDTGRQERLILVNPGANAATVDIVVHGRRGPIDAPAGRGVSVPAHGRTALLLDALAPEEAAPAVHVMSRSGLVAATLVDSWVDGVTPRGVDATGPSAAPALRSVIPAVAGPGEAHVRIVAAGVSDTIAQVRLITRRGRQPLPDADGVQRLAAGTTADVRVTDLPEDVIAVEVTSDQPAVAAVALTRTGRAGRAELAWASAAPVLRGPAGTVLPARGTGETPATRTLSLVSTSARAEADVTLVGSDGTVETQRIAVPEDTATTFPLGGATAVWVAATGGSGALRAAVITSTDPDGDAPPAVSVRALSPARFAARELPVRQARP